MLILTWKALCWATVTGGVNVFANERACVIFTPDVVSVPRKVNADDVPDLHGGAEVSVAEHMPGEQARRLHTKGGALLLKQAYC